MSTRSRHLVGIAGPSNLSVVEGEAPSGLVPGLEVEVPQDQTTTTSSSSRDLDGE